MTKMLIIVYFRKTNHTLILPKLGLNYGEFLVIITPEWNSILSHSMLSRAYHVWGIILRLCRESSTVS